MAAQGSSSSAAIYGGAKLDPERRHPTRAPRHRICVAPPRICPSTLLRAPSAIAALHMPPAPPRRSSASSSSSVIKTSE
ncbi:hypothetical protein ACQJBY_056046 [Aegilops geniculata]